MKSSRFRRLVQVGAFLRKEIADVVRQPRLLLTLVLGPFLIMAVFGMGYRETPAKLRTLFVVPADSPFVDQVEGISEQIGGFVEYVGVVSDADVARSRLLSGAVDLIVGFPDDPLSSVRSGERATVTVIHTRLDPIEQTAINFAAQLGIDQVNGHILAGVVTGGQEFARPAGAIVAAASAGVDRLEAALAAQDPAATVEALDVLEQAATQLGVSVRATDALTRQLVGDEAAAGVRENLVAPTDGIQSAIAAIRAENSAVSPDRIAQLRTSLSTINDNFQDFISVDAAVLVQPFRSEVQLAVEGVDNVTDWYAPAAVVLMLQQFGVAFGALSFVRERQLGIVDVYRIAPVNALETLVGKYLAYLLLGGAIGAVLLALVVAVLGVPVAAGIGELAIVMALTLFAAVGLGFLISLASTTDTQAVQYTILVLLSSLFFSGFFLSLGQLEGAARVASGLLPVSYGMSLLRDVMLRGAPIDRPTGIALAAYGVGMFALALLGTRRRMSMRR